MSPWMSDEDKQKLLEVMNNLQDAGHPQGFIINVLRAKMDLDTNDAQMKAAVAEEKAANATEIAARASVENARYMLWSVIAAAVSAIASLVSTAIAVFAHH